MSTIKALRDRKKTVQSTRKITMAMKMVAGAKLRRASEKVEAGRPYAHLMHEILSDLALRTQALETRQPLLLGTGKKDLHLLLVMTSDRGLCGSFNASIIRHTRKIIRECQTQGQTPKLFCIGRKGKSLLEKEYGPLIIESFTEVGLPRLRFSDAQYISETLLKMFDDGIFDVCTLIYNHFKSALKQENVAQQIIPLWVEEADKKTLSSKAIYEYEPNEIHILNQLLPQNIAVQIYNALLENAASEEGARMTAMDSATRNADEMLSKLSLAYNRTRQMHITRELIEIISGAEVLA
jgi:F-type H+-transporting ATPase subunit gamma